MKCFYHPDVDAVGICKSCSKGICLECAADLGKGIACKGNCEDEVKIINQLMERSKGTYKKTSGAYGKNAIVLLLLAFLSIGFGLLNEIGGYFSYYLFGTGIIFVIASIFNFINAKKFKENGVSNRS